MVEERSQQMPFVDRRDAGRRLAERLMYLQAENVVVLGLPRGGVPVAFEVARALGAPLDVIVVRKLRVPFQPELAMGAVGEGGARVLNDEVVRMAEVSQQELAAVEDRERVEVDRRARRFRGDRPRVSLAGRVAVVIDDGIATGATARAACLVAKSQGAARVILAVPVAPPSTVRELGHQVEIVCIEAPANFWAVGRFYREFVQTSDEEVTRLLAEFAQADPVSVVAEASADDPPARDEEVEVVAGRVTLAGHLTVPERSSGIVVFAHGSGSSRHSPRNRFVADILNRSGLATLLFDLLTRDEEFNRSNVFDIELLGGRLGEVTSWLGDQPRLQHLPMGYFGASTGAGAALWAAAQPDCRVAAVVSRGGRPDLASVSLPQVRAPTLLVVGGLDRVILELNRQALAQLRCQKRLAVVPGATHLFEEPGTLASAAVLARDWLQTYLSAVAQTPR
jgi:putative phosphoribosyl transferase